MKKQNFFSVINTLLLSAMLVFIILIYNNSKDCCKDENKNESIEKTFNEKIGSLSKELNILKLGVDSLKKNCCNEIKAIPIPAKKEVVTNHRMEQLKKEKDYFKRKFETPEPKKEIASDTIKKENIQAENEAVERKDSSHIVVEEYFPNDTLTYLNVFYKGNLYYYHPYKDYSLLNNQIDLTKKQIIQNSAESLLGIGLFVGGLFIPDIKTKVVSDVNLNIGGNIVTTSVESIKYRTSPWKIGLIAAGTALALDGIRRNISTIKIFNSAQLEIETYPIGLGAKIKF